MGAWGALIMSFFGAVFAALTMYWQGHVSGSDLALPFIVFALIGMVAAYVIRQPGPGMALPDRVGRVIMWSSIGEGVGLFIASNVVINLHRLDLRLPAMALVVGAHFLPIAHAASFPPFLVLGGALIVSGLAGMVIGGDAGGLLAGSMAAGALWLAALLALRRDWRAKRQATLIG